MSVKIYVKSLAKHRGILIYDQFLLVPIIGAGHQTLTFSSGGFEFLVPPLTVLAPRGFEMQEEEKEKLDFILYLKVA